jgi:serine/threonine-protein kinase
LTILEEIGAGQFGTVYRAFDTSLQIEVALKLSANASSPYAAALIREARLLAKVRHPNVVRVYGADYSNGRVGVWMDLVRGRTLAAMLETERCSADDAAALGLQLCRALAAVHSVNVLHGDVKPHNVIRRDDGTAVLVDFGAGRSLEATSGDEPDLAGTLLYIAPEVLRGARRSRVSDIYSLGVLLFHLVTDAYPVFETTLAGAIAAHENGRIARLRDLRPDLPAGFIQIVERATAVDPAARYQSAGALEADLVRGVVTTGRTRRVGRGPMAVIAAAGVWMFRDARTSLDVSSPRSAGTTVVPAGATTQPTMPATELSFDIDASFFRETAGARLRMDAGSRVRVGDELNLSVKTSRPTYLYVVNEDERGESYLLFPLPSTQQSSLIPAGKEVRVPASYNWEVSSAGGREHFLVFASPTRLNAFETIFETLPSPRVGASRAERLPADVADRLRGVGGLKPTAPAEVVERLRSVGGLKPSVTPAVPPASRNLRDLFQTPLRGAETATGLWVRQLTVEATGGRR